MYSVKAVFTLVPNQPVGFAVITEPKKLIYNFFYFSFQKILQNLPEKIYNRWQFHSIGKSCYVSEHGRYKTA